MDSTSAGGSKAVKSPCCPRNGRSNCTLHRLIYEAKASGVRDPARALMSAAILMLIERGRDGVGSPAHVLCSEAIRVNHCGGERP